MAKSTRRSKRPPAGRLTTELVPVAGLKPHPRNPRRIDPAAFGGLAKSMDRFGLVEPIIVNRRTGYVVGGHQRLAVLQGRGAQQTDVVTVDLSESEETALMLALNNTQTQGTFTEDLAALVDEIKGADPDLAGDLRLGELVEAMAATAPPEKGPRGDSQAIGEHFSILVECENETQQTLLLGRFLKEGLKCKAYVL